MIEKNPIYFFKQTVAKKLHDTEVDMQIVKTKSECDHVQFLITDTSGPGVVSNPMIAELETLSVGEWTCRCLLR